MDYFAVQILKSKFFLLSEKNLKIVKRMMEIVRNYRPDDISKLKTMIILENYINRYVNDSYGMKFDVPGI